jgi:hypothetical protein
METRFLKLCPDHLGPKDPCRENINASPRLILTYIQAQSETLSLPCRHGSCSKPIGLPSHSVLIPFPVRGFLKHTTKFIALSVRRTSYNFLAPPARTYPQEIPRQGRTVDGTHPLEDMLPSFSFILQFSTSRMTSWRQFRWFLRACPSTQTSVTSNTRRSMTKFSA